MRNEVLARIAHPEKLESLPNFVALDRAKAASGKIRLANDALEITTSDAPWSYAAVLGLNPAAVAKREPTLVAITGVASTGRVGVLFADNAGLVREVFFDSSDGQATKFLQLDHITPETKLIVRTAQHPRSAIFALEAVEAARGFDGQFVSDPAYSLKAVTELPFVAKAERKSPFEFGSLTTTETCNLSCVFCHFNGPKAAKKAKTLSREQVNRVLDQVPRGEEIWIAATGELFMDPNALDHLRTAVSLGHRVAVLSHGQMFTPELLDQVLEIGVRTIRMSCDSIDPVQFRKIRRGGELSRILEAASYLKEQKKRYKDLRVEIGCTLLSNTFDRQSEFESFWSDKVDRLLFNVEYYDVFKYRRTFCNPAKRHNCEIKTYVVPSGHIAPCCAIMVYQHEGDASWLPHVDTHTLAEAYEQLCDMYDDPESPLSKLCRKCDWWIMWAPNEQANGSGYFRYVDFERPNPTAALSMFSRFRKAIGQLLPFRFGADS